MLWCWLAVWLAAACTGTAPRSVPDGAAAPISDSVGVETSVPALQHNAAADRPAGRERVAGLGSGERSALPLMSAPVGPPFGRADFYSGPGVVRDGVWVTLGPNDVPGPLWHASPGIRMRMVGQVFDVCVLEEAWIISYGYRPSSGVPAFFVGPWRRDSPECSRSRAVCQVGLCGRDCFQPLCQDQGGGVRVGPGV